MKPILIIGSKLPNAYVGSTDFWCSCINAAAGMGGGHVPMVVYIEYDNPETTPKNLELIYEQDNSQG